MDANKKLLLATISGICTGLLVHATLSSLGLSAFLQSSPKLYTALKFTGAGYLIYLGARSLYKAAGEGLHHIDTGSVNRTTYKKNLMSEFRIGLLTNILNPKVAVFYITFLSPFIDPLKSVLLQSILLSGVHVLMSAAWLLLIGIFVGYFKVHLESAKVRRILEVITGMALVAFGLKLVF